jgi:hypothetical protein
MKKTAVILFLLLSFGFFLAAGTATAATTGILPGSEAPLAQPGGILDQLYGLGNLQRVDDSIDTVWVPANGNATATAKFANFTQEFGYIPDLNEPGFADDSFVSLFTVPGGTNGIGLGGPSAVLNSGNVAFLWALDPNKAPLWTSLPSQNSDGLDHMVTWNVVDTPNTWVIAWEDLAGGGDRDFNDLVVEVNLAPVPIPPAILLLGSGLVTMLGIRRRFKS